jgi:hypothetical protein
MKSLKLLFAISAFLAFAIPVSAEDLSAKVAAIEVPSLPSNMSGRWYTLDHMYSQTWGVKNIDLGRQTGLLSWGSTRSGCGREDVPAVVTYDGTTLTVAPVDIAAMGKFCTDKWSARLEKKGEKKFSGLVEVGYNPAQYPHLEITLE